MTSLAMTLIRGPVARGTCLIVGSQLSSTVRSRAVPLLRTYSTKPEGGAHKGGSLGGSLFSAVAGAALGAGAYYLYSTGQLNFGGGKLDYQKVYNEIAKILEDPGYDDGSYGPVFIRLAWHASGTYDKDSNTGGSCRGTMRFNPEINHGANAGLHIAIAKLEKIKQKFPAISYGDLWTLAGVVAIQEMGGPTIPWRAGRVDGTATECPPEGRLPDGDNPSPQHPRDVFYRMGFNDQEIVALIGAHTLGRCHTDRSGFDGPWTDSPTTFSNSYFVEILGRNWVERKWAGPKQFADKESGNLMMLPADMAFVKDKEFKKWVETYAKDEKKFFDDFTQAWKKLIELGVAFKEDSPEFKFNLAPAE